MASTSVMYVDDVDTSADGLVVASVTGLGDVPTVEPITRERWGWQGLLETAPSVPKIKPRVITVTGILKAASVATLETNLDTLKRRFTANSQRVRFVNIANREWIARLTELAITPVGQGGQFVNPWVNITLKLTALDPYGYDTSDTTVTSITDSDKAAAVGTAPSRPVLRCTGAATNPLWTYKDGSGNTITTLQLTISVAGGDYVEVDCEAMTIKKSVSSVITDALDTLTSGDFITLHPRDGASPTLRLSSGTGLATYRKAWL